MRELLRGSRFNQGRWIFPAAVFVFPIINVCNGV
jgi:hypothetical protein